MLNEIKKAEKKDMTKIVDLLNEVTLSLHQRNINQWTYPWSFEEIDRDVENGNVYIVTINNIIAGTFSIRNMNANPVFHLSEQNNLYLYRIAVLPEYQGKNIGHEITDYALRISGNLKKTIYLDCWAGNTKLKEFYSNAGFDFCGDFPEEDYMISVFKSK